MEWDKDGTFYGKCCICEEREKVNFVSMCCDCGTKFYRDKIRMRIWDTPITRDASPTECDAIREGIIERYGRDNEVVEKAVEDGR